MHNPEAPFSILFLVLTIGLISRLTKLAVDDAITQPIRDKIHAASVVGGSMQTVQADPLTGRPNNQTWVENKKTPFRKLAAFVFKVLDCAWCASVWVSAAVVGVAAYVTQATNDTPTHPHLLAAYWWTALAGTASLATGLIQTWTYSKDA